MVTSAGVASFAISWKTTKIASSTARMVEIGQREQGALLKASKTIVLSISVALTLLLTGCFASRAADDFAEAATQFADQMQDLADTLSGIENKVSRLVVRDGETEEVICEVTDETSIEEAFSFLSGVNGLADAPDQPAEYIFELWQPETQKMGQSVDDLEEINALIVTTYRDSSTVTIEIPFLGLTLHLASASQAADALRALVQ